MKKPVIPIRFLAGSNGKIIQPCGQELVACGTFHVGSQLCGKANMLGSFFRHSLTSHPEVNSQALTLELYSQWAGCGGTNNYFLWRVSLMALEGLSVFDRLLEVQQKKKMDFAFPHGSTSEFHPVQCRTASSAMTLPGH